MSRIFILADLRTYSNGRPPADIDQEMPPCMIAMMRSKYRGYDHQILGRALDHGRGRGNCNNLKVLTGVLKSSID